MVSKRKCFLEIYIGVIAFIVLMGWLFSSIISMIILLGVFIIILFVFKDLKYGIPIFLFIIFSISDGFDGENIPIFYISVIGVVVFVLLVFNIIEGFSLKNMSSFIGLLGMGVCNLIPIFWTKLDNDIFYSFYFIGFGYLILYVLLFSGIKSDSIEMLSTSMSFLGVILAFECFIKVLMLKDTTEHIFDLSYYLGWGVCNEAGILMLMSLPFCFYMFGKMKSDWIYQFIKIIIVLIGMVFTMSRGTYLFGMIEVLLLSICLLFFCSNKELYKKIFTVAVLSICVLLIICLPLIDDIIFRVFKDGFSSNGRIKIWKMGFDIWKNHIFFGPGICSKMMILNTPLGYQEVPLVFHSSIVEVLVVGGVVGIVFFIIHLYEKYRCLFKMDRLFRVTSVIGYVVVDLYGLIDNTYYMYYYMIVLVVIMASIDNKIKDSYSM